MNTEFYPVSYPENASTIAELLAEFDFPEKTFDEGVLSLERLFQSRLAKNTKDIAWNLESSRMQPIDSTPEMASYYPKAFSELIAERKVIEENILRVLIAKSL